MSQRYRLDQVPEDMVIEPPFPDDPAPNDPSSNSLASSMADVDMLPPVTDESGEEIDPAAAFGESPVMRAEPVAPEFKGDKFDFTPFNAIADAIEAGNMDAARKLKDQLTPVQQHVLERASMMEAYTPERAAADATAFMDLQARQSVQSQTKDAANKPLGPRELQVAMDDVALMRNTIESIRSHKGRSKALGYRGPLNILAPSYIGGPVDKDTGKQRPAEGTAAAGFSSLIDSSRAKVFLPVIQRMRGFGSMQVREAEAAVNSANRLSLELNESDFGKALEEVEDFADRFEARSRGIPVDQIKKERGAATSSQPAAQETFTTPEGFTYRRLPDGSAELVE